jgi:glutamate 5-kinase
VLVVSSGAIAVGCKRLGLAARPTNIAQRQALAAVGQVHLMRFYDDFFSALGVVSPWLTYDCTQHAAVLSCTGQLLSRQMSTSVLP